LIICIMFLNTIKFVKTDLPGFSLPGIYERYKVAALHGCCLIASIGALKQLPRQQRKI